MRTPWLKPQGLIMLIRKLFVTSDRQPAGRRRAPWSYITSLIYDQLIMGSDSVDRVFAGYSFYSFTLWFLIAYSPCISLPTHQPIFASYFVAEILVLHRPTYLSQTTVRHQKLNVSSIRPFKKWTYGSRRIQLGILNRLFINFKLRIRECILEPIIFQNSTEIDILQSA